MTAPNRLHWLTELRTFAREVIAARTSSFESAGAVPNDVIAELGERGYLAAHVPEDYGGAAVDMTAYGEMHGELGQVSSSLRSLITVHDMVAETILRFGSEEQKHSWMPQLTSGRSLAALALSEPAAGSDAASIDTRATVTKDGYRLSGQKSWVSFGQRADVFLVAAKLEDEGPTVTFLVPRDAPGLEVVPVTGMLGLRAAMLAELHLADCPVPAAARIGPEKAPHGLVIGNALHHGRYSVAWGCVGIGQACLDASLAYSKSRHQFGVPLEDHQLIKRLLTNMITDLQAARLLCERAGERWARRDAAAIQATLIAKYFSSTMAHRVSSDAVQIHGARGLSEEYSLERHFRDARVMEIIEGSTEIQQLLIAGYGLRMANSHGGA